MRRAASDAKEAKRRHLARAFAGIDREAKQPEDRLFRTIPRGQAERLWEQQRFWGQAPQGTDVGKYSPKRPADPRQPCFVSMQRAGVAAAETLSPAGPSATHLHLSTRPGYLIAPGIPNAAPHLDLSPQVSCGRLQQKLERLKNQIMHTNRTTIKKNMSKDKHDSISRSKTTIQHERASPSLNRTLHNSSSPQKLSKPRLFSNPSVGQISKDDRLQHTDDETLSSGAANLKLKHNFAGSSPDMNKYLDARVGQMLPHKTTKSFRNGSVFPSPSPASGTAAQFHSTRDSNPLARDSFAVIKESPRANLSQANIKLGGKLPMRAGDAASKLDKAKQLIRVHDQSSLRSQPKYGESGGRRSVRPCEDALPRDVATSFRMPSLPVAKLNASLIEKSAKLNKIYDQKDLMEKQYGDLIRTMSPINHINR